jgi:hypothetical protein
VVEVCWLWEFTGRWRWMADKDDAQDEFFVV